MWLQQSFFFWEFCLCQTLFLNFNMGLFRKTAGGVLVSLGLLFVLAGIMALVDSTTAAGERVGVFATGAILGLLLVWIGICLLRRPKEQADSTNDAVAEEPIRKYSSPKTEEEIRTALFRLVEQSSGCITLFKFAMETNLSGEDARTFLDAQAKAFGASFLVNDKGDVVYRFPL
ncbi:hypothetical protein LEP3755_13330 [Leptolyngbya sp. NIES-3755]|nr:hypothetical protein LEP3755_13330 [Leptolyngbya sp. NIES-3755]